MREGFDHLWVEQQERAAAHSHHDQKPPNRRSCTHQYG